MVMRSIDTLSECLNQARVAAWGTVRLCDLALASTLSRYVGQEADNPRSIRCCQYARCTRNYYFVLVLVLVLVLV